MHQNRHVLLEKRPHLVGLQTHHCSICWERARAQSEHHSTLGQVIELHYSFGYPKRVVVRKGHDACAQFDPLSPLCRCSDEQLRRRDDLATRRMVFSDPRLVEPELIHVGDQVQIVLERQGWVVVGRVERRHERTERKRIWSP